MHEANRYGFGATGRKLSCQPRYCLLMERLQHLSLCIHPPCNGKGARAGYDQIGFDKVDFILAVTALIGNLQDIAKPLIRHRCNNGPTPLYQSIRGQCRAMYEATDLGPVCPGTSQHVFGTRKRPKSRVFWCGRRFCGGKDMAPLINQYRVGESTADIYGKA